MRGKVESIFSKERNNKTRHLLREVGVPRGTREFPEDDAVDGFDEPREAEEHAPSTHAEGSVRQPAEQEARD